MHRNPVVRLVAESPDMEALTLLLAATSTIEDELERARLIATGIPALLSCRVSGVVLGDGTWTPFLSYPQDINPMLDSDLDLIESLTHARGQMTLRPNDTHEHAAHITALLERLELSSLTVFPMLTLTGQLGMLLIGKADAGGLTRNESRICQTLATTLALGIENLRLTHNLERLVDARTEELRQAEAAQRALLRVNNALVSNLDRESLFNAISDSLREVVEFDRASLTLLDSETGVIEINQVTENVDTHELLPVGFEYPLEESAVGKVLRENKPRIRLHLDQQTLIGEEFQLLQMGFRSYIAVPLCTRGEPFGTLNVSSRDPEAYTETDVEFIAEVGVQVALAAENMLAFEEIDRLKAQAEQENVYLREELETEYNFHEIVGKSPALKKTLRQVEQVAPTDATVLICGETGTGKELIARAIHDASPRKDRTLVKVNCAAISAGLVESELFGHEKGSFTGAIKQHIGRFEVADGGTLFLDEVGELPLDTQVKLLRVLQEGDVERVGSNKPIRVDVRIIAATNRRLDEAVEAGEFRADLFFRLNVFPIEVPALRERKSDIPLLVDYLLAKLSRKLGKPLTGVAKTSMDQLMGYRWPGNIRELENVIERSAILSPGQIIEVDDLSVAGALSVTDEMAAPATASEIGSLEDAERAHILAALERTNWVIAGARGAAAVLDIHTNTLRSRMKKLGIKRSVTAE